MQSQQLNKRKVLLNIYEGGRAAYIEKDSSEKEQLKLILIVF